MNKYAVQYPREVLMNEEFECAEYPHPILKELSEYNFQEDNTWHLKMHVSE